MTKSLVEVGPASYFQSSQNRVLITLENGSSITAFKSGTCLAFESICPHSGGPLHLSDIEEYVPCKRSTDDLESNRESWTKRVVCPWHEYAFNVESGAGIGNDLNVDIYDAEIIDGQFMVDFKGVQVAVIEKYTLKNKTQDDAFEMKVVSESLDIIDYEAERSLCEWAVLILKTSDAQRKVELTLKVHKMWTLNQIKNIGASEDVPGGVPNQPFRDMNLKVVQPWEAVKWKNGGTPAKRIAILHSLANVEQWAIDLAWDLIARFAHCLVGPNEIPLPRYFFDDFIRVAYEEATHFVMLCEQLEMYNSSFGSLPVHLGLWESATVTAHDLCARLAIVHMVHEARGLDVNPATILKFRNNGDEISSVKLEKIHKDEIGHVSVGQKWFSWVCEQNGTDRYSTFHDNVRLYFRGPLRPPFNDKDRIVAGLDPQFYMPVSKSR